MTTASDILHTGQQQNLLTLLCHSDEHGKVVANLVDANLFEGDYRIVAEKAIEYWRQQGQAPKSHTADLFDDIFDDPQNCKAPTFRRILIAMLRLNDEGINAAYVLSQVNKFVRMQKFKGAILRSAEQVNAQQEMAIEEVEKIWIDLLHTNRTTFDVGVRLDDVDHLLKYLADREQSEFVTGIPILDKRRVVPTRETVMVLLGGPGAGKSWWQVHLGREALVMRKKVLHVTLELSAAETQKRYYQMFLAVPAWDNHLRSDCTKLLLDEHGQLTGFGRKEIVAKFSMQTPNIDKQLRELSAYVPSLKNLLIKHFPTRSLTVQGLRQYLIQLEATNFLPDLIIVDYAGIMHTDAKDHRIQLGRLVEDLRGLASERKVAISTAQQINREGSKATVVGMEHVAEDWSIAGTADFMLTLSRTDEEKRRQLARLYVHKNREGEQDFGVVLAQHIPHGQFKLTSCDLDLKQYLDLLEPKDME